MGVELMGVELMEVKLMGVKLMGLKLREEVKGLSEMNSWEVN